MSAAASADEPRAAVVRLFSPISLLFNASFAASRCCERRAGFLQSVRKCVSVCLSLSHTLFSQKGPPLAPLALAVSRCERAACCSHAFCAPQRRGGGLRLRDARVGVDLPTALLNGGFHVVRHLRRAARLGAEQRSRSRCNANRRSDVAAFPRAGGSPVFLLVRVLLHARAQIVV